MDGAGVIMVCPICDKPHSAPWEPCGHNGPSPVTITGNVISVGGVTMPYYAKERLYVDAAGKVYREDELNERSEVTLLMSEGGELSDADAEKYGLTGKGAGALVSDAPPEADVVDADADAVDAKAVSAAPANKARQPASSKDS